MGLQLDVNVSYPLAFVAGVLSFLSPCVFPIVPSYVAFVSGMTLEELSEGSGRSARMRAVVHSTAFGIGFGLVFMTLGAATTAAGARFAQALPWITRAGGVLVLAFGLHLLGVFRIAGLMRERRLNVGSKPAGVFGSLLVGVAFGAGWTPCIGPVLASILLFASLEHTVVEGTLLLGTYGLGLAVPFLGAAIGFNWFLASMAGARRWLPWVERAGGILLLAIGLMMVTGQFVTLNAMLADMGQLIELEIE